MIVIHRSRCSDGHQPRYDVDYYCLNGDFSLKERSAEFRQGIGSSRHWTSLIELPDTVIRRWNCAIQSSSKRCDLLTGESSLHYAFLINWINGFIGAGCFVF